MPLHPIVYDELKDMYDPDRVEYLSDLVTPERIVKGLGGVIIGGYFRRPALPVMVLHESKQYVLKDLPHAVGRKLQSRGRGGASGTTPTATILSKRRQGRAFAEHGKHGGPRRESRRGGRARRKECLRGHYWSYKEKKCVKSKF